MWNRHATRARGADFCQRAGQGVVSKTRAPGPRACKRIPRPRISHGRCADTCLLSSARIPRFDCARTVPVFRADIGCGYHYGTESCRIRSNYANVWTASIFYGSCRSRGDSSSRNSDRRKTALVACAFRTGKTNNVSRCSALPTRSLDRPPHSRGRAIYARHSIDARRFALTKKIQTRLPRILRSKTASTDARSRVAHITLQNNATSSGRVRPAGTGLREGPAACFSYGIREGAMRERSPVPFAYPADSGTSRVRGSREPDFL